MKIVLGWIDKFCTNDSLCYILYYGHLPKIYYFNKKAASSES